MKDEKCGPARRRNEGCEPTNARGDLVHPSSFLLHPSLRGLVSLTLLTGLAWRTEWGPITRAFADLRPELWLAAVGLYLAAQLASALRWQWLARPLGFRHSLGQLTAFSFIGMYFNLVLPTSVGGDVVRAWYLDGGSHRRLLAFLSVFVDRLSGLLVLLALACAAVVVCPIALPAWVAASVWGTAGGALFGLGALPALARWTGRFDRARRLVDGVRLYLRHGRLLLATTGLSLLVQAANVVLVWLVGQAIDAPVPASYYWVLVPMVTLLTLLPVSLNGMGVREGGMVLFLTPLGVPAGTALSLAVLWFSVFAAASLCGGGVYLCGRFPRPEGQPDHEPVRGDSDQGRTGQPQAAPGSLTASA
jgi:uncharacterized membrane protein YbhN (UPF0104 family)